MGTADLTPVVRVDEEKCINCYACITACPVKYCIDGSGDKLVINSNLCIGCGNCIHCCTHKARRLVDDTTRFYEDLQKKVPIIAVVAPAVASVFPGQFLNFNGYLKSLGVEAVFDVSFGAELTVISYLDYIKEKKPRTVIAQPCPAIVSYIEIYQPKLLPYLAPADSPMLHTVKMIREYFPKYNDHKIAVISPCIAKKREFDETGLGDYNVTMAALKERLEAQEINIASFPQVEYVGAHAERAVGFSSPGGLLDTAERFVPGIRRKTYKVEGVHTIYPYLAEIAELLDTDVELSLLVDCLNCEKGCNGGPGTGNAEKPTCVLENPIRKRRSKLEEYHKSEKGEWIYKKYHKVLNKYWKKGLYNRTYRNISGNITIKQPNERELTEAFHKLRKFKPEDIYNCTACGYGSCKAMATAIHNKLNKPENCLHYNHNVLRDEKKVMEGINQKFHAHIDHAIGLIKGINEVVKDMDVRIDEHLEAVSSSTSVAEKVVGDLKVTSEFSRKKQETIQGFVENASKGQESMQETIQSVDGISKSVDGIASAIKIIGAIAANTNLLAMNAAIEAAHAGAAGRGFAVVADEIRRLSESTRENSRNISQTLSSIIEGINVTSKRSDYTNTLINTMSEEIGGFASAMTEMIGALGNMTGESTKITSALGKVKDHNTEVKSGYADMLSKTSNLVDEMNTLVKEVSAEMANITSS